MIHTALVPVDFSQAGETAIHYAIKLAEKVPYSITLLHVLSQVPDIPSQFAFNGHFEVPEYRRALRESALVDMHALERRLSPAHGERKVMVLFGDPAEEIAKVAREIDADLIIMATHGRRGFSRAVHGSVTEKVVRIAPCSVLCVRPKAGPEAGAEAA